MPFLPPISSFQVQSTEYGCSKTIKLNLAGKEKTL